MKANEWLDSFVDALGADASSPDEATREILLELAGVAAHSSERVAAPIACYIAGRAGVEPAVALRLARSLAA